MKVIGKGNINFITKNGCVKIISNIFYVPDLKSNLLSVGQLLKKGMLSLLGMILVKFLILPEELLL